MVSFRTKHPRESTDLRARTDDTLTSRVMDLTLSSHKRYRHSVGLAIEQLAALGCITNVV